MAEISAAMVQELREATNVGMMECKRALVEAGGDKDKAIRILRERGIATAAKKADRVANQGLVGASVSPDGRCGALAEVNCETDFVAKNESFRKFVQDMADRGREVEANLADAVKSEVVAKIAEIGENIVVRRHARFVLQGNGLVATYIHLTGKLGVMLELGCTKPESAAHPELRELAKDLAMHVAACNPRCLDRTQVAAELVTAEREIYAKQVTGKPAQIVDKIVDGKMGKFYSQICLVEQGFVKEPDLPVNKLLEAKGKAIGDTVQIRRFVRFQLGE